MVGNGKLIIGFTVAGQAPFGSIVELQKVVFFARLLAVATPMEISGRILSPFAGVVNRVRFDLPSRYLQTAGRNGDDRMCSSVLRELRRRGKRS